MPEELGGAPEFGVGSIPEIILETKDPIGFCGDGDGADCGDGGDKAFKTVPGLKKLVILGTGF